MYIYGTTEYFYIYYYTISRYLVCYTDAFKQAPHRLWLLQDAESNWQFDIFAFADATPGRTLALLTLHFYQISGFIQHYSLSPTKLFTYLQKLESGYDSSNPYHNRSVRRFITLAVLDKWVKLLCVVSYSSQTRVL